MNITNADKLYLYYQQKDSLPTYARFTSREELDKYRTLRHNLFLSRLHLPPGIFEGANLIEFGPDAGENSLVFASWGANVTLVEPNPKAWPCILDYFKRFSLQDKLKSLVKTDLESFKTKERFRFVDAEGFIYTVRPASRWISLFNSILGEDGFFIISYCEAFGSFLELILKLIYSRAKNLTGLDSKDIAWKLFQAKWESIPHTRSFDSWVMDALENPFVRREYFLDAALLYQQLSESGFSLYSSWPNYSDSLSVYWYKIPLATEDRMGRDLDFIRRSCLSFAFGRKLFLSSESAQTVKVASEELMKLLILVDESIDGFDSLSFKSCYDYIEKIRSFMVNNVIIADSKEDKLEALQLLESIKKIFELLIAADPDTLITFCNSDSTFIKSWGMPNHFAVFHKNRDAL